VRRPAVTIAIALLVSSCAVQAGPPAVGDVAPGFVLAGSDGETYDLADYRGRKVVVVAWFPKAFTGG
jgi:peroxiredoxin Q/BCP